MKKANKLTITKLIRKSCATTLVLVLLPHPWVSEAKAQSAVNVGMQAISTLSSTIQQGLMQAQSMRPVNLAPSQVRSVPAVNLPAPLNECLIPPAKIPMPRYCEQLGPPTEYITPAGLAASPSYNQFSQTSEFAKQQILELDRMLDMGKNEASNGARTGLQCLVDKQLKEKTRRQAVQNAIQARIDDIKQKNEAFKEQVKLVELQMKKIRGELLGADDGDAKHVSDLLNPPIKNFPPNCQAIVEKAQPDAQRVGLYSLKEATFKPAARSGGEFLANQQLYKNDMQRFVNEARAYVAKNGIDSFRQNGLPSFKGNKKLVERISKSLQPFSARVEQEEKTIRDELKKVGYEAPALDRNFKSDFEVFKSDSKEFFRKKAVSECVTGGNNGITLDPKTILDALRQESTNNQGTTIISYKSAMENILASDSFIEDKISQLKALDDRYGAGTVTLTLSNAKAQLERMPPYMYFQNAVSACVNEYNDDKTFSASSQGRSQAVKIDRAEAYLNDLKKLNDTFVEDMTKEITNDIVNCNGRTAEAGSCTLDGNSFNVTSDSFCFQSAQSCAAEINNCSAIAEKLVQDKTTELTAASDQYNNMVATLFTEQAATFGQFKAAVMQEAGLLNALIPGADFVFPEDNFISMPELTLDPKTNTYIRGGDSATIARKLNAMAGKMGELKTALAEQGKKADRQIDKYIAEQEQNIQDNKKSFEDLVQACEGRIAEASNINSDYIAKMQKNEQDAKSAAGDFCRRFYDLSTNPNAACGDVEDLYDASIRAAQFVDISARRYANNLRNLCNETQSEREAGTEEGSSRAQSVQADIAQSCQDDANWNSAITSYISQYAKSLPEGDARDMIVEHLDPDSGSIKNSDDDIKALIADLPEEFAENSDAVKDLRRVIKLTRPGSYSRNASVETMMSQLSLPNYNKDASVTGVVATTLSSLNSATKASDKARHFKTLAGYLNSTDAATKEAAQVALGNVTSVTIPGDLDAKAKQIDAAIAKLPSGETVAANGTTPADETGDNCHKLLADAAVTALSKCTSSTDASCIDTEYDEALEDNNFRPARNVASLGLSPGNQADVSQLFTDLGETDGMACDALASNRRNSVSDIERLDRDILGDQYDDLMRR